MLVLASALIWAEPSISQSLRDGSGGEVPLPAASESVERKSDVPASESIQTSLGPAGDIGGIRGTLAEAGFTYSLTYIGEVLGNTVGGERRGTVYQGRLDAQFDIDLNRVAGWSGATLHTNFYQIHGRGLSGNFIGNLLSASNIEALPATRLFELWLEQKLLDDRLSVRAGQLAADTEFVVSQYSGLFINSTFGFPGLLAANLPNGGPAYPLATPGIRAKYSPTDNLSGMVGVFNGAPAGMRATDPQRQDRSGLEFRTTDPALIMAELAYTFDVGQEGAARPGTVKFGAWTHLGRFDDLRFAAAAEDASSLRLADPGSSGSAQRFRGNGGGYVVFDQLLYRPEGVADGGLGMFVRLLGAPGDRNLLSFYTDGGLTYKGLIPGRPDDTMGVSVAYAQFSGAVRGFDADLAALNPGVFQPIRSSEGVLELTYQAQIVPGWTVQPDLQYVRRPGGGIVNSRSGTGATIKDAVVLGVRSSIRY